MGVKTRLFRPMVNMSLEELVPANHFYCHVERTLDLTFVRDLVRDRYSAFGRSSIDPVVFFKLQLVMFFEGIRSERQLEYVGSDRLSVRWYLGYGLNEPLPDRSSMTRIRDSYGITIFRRFFGEGQQWRRLRRFRLRTLAKVNCEGVITAMGQSSNGCSRGAAGVGATAQVRPTVSYCH